MCGLFGTGRYTPPAWLLTVIQFNSKNPTQHRWQCMPSRYLSWRDSGIIRDYIGVGGVENRVILIQTVAARRLLVFSWTHPLLSPPRGRASPRGCREALLKVGRFGMNATGAPVKAHRCSTSRCGRVGHHVTTCVEAPPVVDLTCDGDESTPVIARRDPFKTIAATAYLSS